MAPPRILRSIFRTALAAALLITCGDLSSAQFGPPSATVPGATPAPPVALPNGTGAALPSVSVSPSPTPLPSGQPWNSDAQPIEARQFEAAQIIARVGSEIILGGDVLATVDGIMEDNRDRIPPSAFDRQRQMLMQQVLQRLIETKLVVVDALRSIPADNLPNIEEQVTDQFYKSRVKQLMADTKTHSIAQLEAKLLENGTSIEQQRRSYFERSLSSQWIRQKTQSKDPITHEEKYKYYTEHLADYENEAKARWEQLTAQLDKHASESAAYQAIATMGNEVLVRRVPFADVARARSQGSTARDGGSRDWTTKGALVSDELDRAVFSLPVGQLSTILEDKVGYHIIRVTERVDAHRTPFRDAQVEIEETIKLARRKAKLEEYFEQLREDVRVWTIFDDVAEPAVSN